MDALFNELLELSDKEDYKADLQFLYLKALDNNNFKFQKLMWNLFKEVKKIVDKAVIKNVNKAISELDNQYSYFNYSKRIINNLAITAIINKYKPKSVNLKGSYGDCWFMKSSNTIVNVDVGHPLIGNLMESGDVIVKEFDEHWNAERFNNELAIESSPIKSFIRGKGRLTFSNFIKAGDKTYDYIMMSHGVIINYTLFSDRIRDSFKVYPVKGEIKTAPYDLMKFSSKFNFNLNELIDIYEKYWRSAISFMQKLELSTKAGKPSLLLEKLKANVPASYQDENHVIRLNYNYTEYLEIALFHEIIHAILHKTIKDSEAQKDYKSVKEIKFFFKERVVLSYKPKFIVEGLTDFLTYYYFTNVEKVKRFDLSKVQLGYPEERKVIGELFYYYHIKQGIPIGKALKKILRDKEEVFEEGVMMMDEILKSFE